MNDERRDDTPAGGFEVDDDAGAARPGPRPTPSSPSATPLRRPSPSSSQAAAPSPTPRSERTAASARRRAGAASPVQRVDDTGAPVFAGTRRIFYVLGAVLTAALLFLTYNPEHGIGARMWPWEMFREGGALALVWDKPLAFVVIVSLILIALVIATLLPGRRPRGVLGLLAVSLAFVAFYIEDYEVGETIVSSADEFVAPIALMLVTAGAMALRPAGSRWGARVLLLVGVGLLAQQAFYPRPGDVAEGEIARPGYGSNALQTFDLLFDDERGLGSLEPSQRSGMTLWVAANVAILAMLVVGLIALAGLGGVWAAWVAVGLGVAFVLFMPGWAYWIGARDAGYSASDIFSRYSRDGAALALQNLQGRFTPFLLPLAAAAADLFRRQRPDLA